MINKPIGSAALKHADTSTQSARDGSLKYRRDVDGLRAIAVLSVVLYHVFPNILPGGFTGVDVFFVISGFLISRIIWDGLSEGHFSYLDFYRRRILRIFPALGLVLAATWIAGYALLFWDEFSRLGKHILSGAFFFSNFTLWHEGGYFDIAAERKPLLHLWSLSIEEQFYIVWPLILAGWWRLGRSFGLIAVPLGAASLAFSAYMTDGEPTAAFYNPLSRFWELLLGASIGHLAREGFSFKGAQGLAVSVVSLAALVCTFFLFSRSTPFPGAYALIPAGATALLLLCHPQSGLSAALLSRRLLVGIGLISYPFYLWHWPIFSLAYIEMQGFVSPSAGVCIVVASLALAWGTYSLLEKPLRKRSRGWAVSGVLAGVVFALGGLGWATEARRGFIKGSRVDKTAPFLTEKRAIESWLKERRTGTCYLEGELGAHPASCVEELRPLVFLWGDSHAAALYPGFRDLKSKLSFGFAEMTQSGCPPLPGAVSHIRKNCAAINEDIFSTIEKLKPEVLVLAAAWVSSSYASPKTNEALITGLREQITKIRAALPETKVVVIGPLLRWEPDLPKVLYSYVERTGEMPPRYLAIPDTGLNRRIREVDEQMSTLVASLGATYISPQPYFCEDVAAQSCLTRMEDSQAGLVVYDDGHLNSAAAIYFVSELSGILFN